MAPHRVFQLKVVIDNLANSFLMLFSCSFVEIVISAANVCDFLLGNF